MKKLLTAIMLCLTSVWVQIENDKFGNIVYCGTENAVNDAGIRAVKVKV